MRFTSDTLGLTSLLVLSLLHETTALPSHLHVRHEQVHQVRDALLATPSIVFPLNYKQVKTIITPSAAPAQLLGFSASAPEEQYIEQGAAAPQTKLDPRLLSSTWNSDMSVLTTQSPIDTTTGSLVANLANIGLIKPMTCTPVMSRDGGKGGYLNGQKMFIFADTSITCNGKFAGFVSTSAAIEQGNAGKQNKALTLSDKTGEWANSIGTMRGFIPLTVGEQSFNGQNGVGSRIAIWPESSIIPIDGVSALLYAPIVFLSKSPAGVLTTKYIGNTLTTITADQQSGPLAARTVPQLFTADEPEWGNIGGIRSTQWGVGNSAGSVYVMARGNGGLLLARADATKVADRNAYQYYQGNQQWSKAMPNVNTTDAFFVTGDFSTVDVFYSPRHLTFVMVYQDTFADDKFYWQYLQAPVPIIPEYAGGAYLTDYVEEVTQHSWSAPQVLYQAAPGKEGAYIYSGGVNMGYFDQDDIINGGNKMLIGWVTPEGDDANATDQGYQHTTAVIEWN